MAQQQGWPQAKAAIPDEQAAPRSKLLDKKRFDQCARQQESGSEDEFFNNNRKKARRCSTMSSDSECSKDVKSQSCSHEQALSRAKTVVESKSENKSYCR